MIGVGWIIFWLLIVVLMIVSMWKIFTKAGQPGWAAIVPFYNLFILLRITGRPEWWIILWLIPCVNIVIQILVYIDLARVFGKSTGFAIGLILLPFVFFPVLAFSDAEYGG
ncbi:signal peptidase I [bacterium]|nr:signal peptidase I [bacterium]